MFGRKSTVEKLNELLIKKINEIVVKTAAVELKNARVELKINRLNLKLLTEVFDLDKKRNRRYIT